MSQTSTAVGEHRPARRARPRLRFIRVELDPDNAV
jgi:hypothetical protein